MTDEEILRRLAEIEGFVDGAEKEWDWNPLADTERGRSQAFELVEKYHCDIDYGPEVWWAWCPGKPVIASESESLARAICLAVIASKEQSHEQ